MIIVDVPGYRTLEIKHLVLDYNGTLAVDGRLIGGVGECLKQLAADLEIHVITADTFGKVESGMKGIPCKVSILGLENQDLAKLEYVNHLGAEHTACVGNGRNDRLMLEQAVLGIAVILGEGASSVTVQAADVVCTDIISALELLMHPLRLTATLRT